MSTNLIFVFSETSGLPIAIVLRKSFQCGSVRFINSTAKYDLLFSINSSKKCNDVYFC